MSDGHALRVDGDRLWASLMDMAEIGATARGGSDRQALTDEDLRGRELFARWCEEAGCTVRLDAFGNLFARRSGDDDSLAPVMAGSHLDTQPAGGRFDGACGVLSGLEVVRTLNDAGVSTRGPIEVVSWTNEEGARFAPAMLGSGVWAGVFDLEESYEIADQQGRTVGEELDRLDLKGQAVAERPHAAFEVHIEQGPVLEREGLQIGVVEGVQGIRWYDLVVEGQPCHAGTTPMELREDPVRVTVSLLDELYSLVEQDGPEGRLTFGRMHTLPGSRNTVPEQAHVSIDLRHPEDSRLDALEAAISRRVAESRGARLEPVWTSEAIEFDAGCIDAVTRAVGALGYSHRAMISGAGHDSVYVSKVAPTSMIFIPCENGLSHCESEYATPADVTAGCNVLLHAMLDRDRSR